MSCYLADWLRGQASVGEESLTDWALYELARHVRWVHYEKHSHRQEARTGADWEWWFVFPGRALGMLVQAKRVPLGGSALSAGDFRRGGPNRAPQHQALLDFARAERMLPVYAFYCADAGTPPPSCCLAQPCACVHGGAFLTAAQVIAGLVGTGSGGIPVGQLLGPSTPLPCLFCPTLAGSAGQVASIPRAVQAGFEAREGQDADGWRPEPPGRVRRLLDQRAGRGEGQAMSADANPPLAGATLVCDLREFWSGGRRAG